ncbi:AAA family ATPase [Chelativorans sp. AA-79]|uniref:AAA family ATPase n=1 Tax=Chelativorans sp. AA-79 TaxID=3028735 RepID=UPI0023F74F34|nr:AAA family ATPase [Chelativorans sp. AA-79]WEX08940.1 AAA family ATPase [Chelativorans sp. AA-79]
MNAENAEAVRQMAKKVYISPDTVKAGLRSLVAQTLKRTGRTALMGFLMLKAKEPSKGAQFELHSNGSLSVEPELRRFFRVAPGTPFPDVNPFGQREGAIEFLAPGYERRGTYTHLYEGRNLNSLLEVTPKDGHFSIKIPDGAAERIADLLGGKAPLRATAAFLLRSEPFDVGATEKDLIERFKSVFKLSDADIDALFETDAGFSVAFSTEKFDNSLAALPSDLQPRSPSVTHATTARAAKELVPMAATSDTELVISKDVRRRVQGAVASSKAVSLVGPPGTAKSRLWAEILEEAAADPSLLGLENPPSYVCYTAEIDWTARTLIGGYYPQKDGQLIFREGYLLQAIRNNQIFWIDEMNRADLDRVLGPILTFLAGQSVDLGPTHLGDDKEDAAAKSMVLVWAKGDKSGVKEDSEQRVYYAGTDWRMIGTYNNVDRGRVFPMGSALLRRWALVPIPPLDAEAFAELLAKLPKVREPVIGLLKAAYELHLEALPIGPAPFLDMARYVSGGAEASADAGVTPQERELLKDAYVLYMGQQLIRLDPEKREQFFNALGGIFGHDLASEAASF